jgi:hypothetical protein
MMSFTSGSKKAISLQTLRLSYFTSLSVTEKKKVFINLNLSKNKSVETAGLNNHSLISVPSHKFFGINLLTLFGKLDHCTNVTIIFSVL